MIGANNVLIVGLGLLLGLNLPAGAADSLPKPLFSRHVVPLFSRLGCNAGACRRS